MKVSPGCPRDLWELIEAIARKEGVDLKRYGGYDPESQTASYLISMMKEILQNFHQQAKICCTDESKDLLYFFNVIIEGIGDYAIAVDQFQGVMKYTVARGICQQSRVFLCCLNDEEFAINYLKGYSDAKEKKTRYHGFNKESKIKEKLAEIIEKADEAKMNDPEHVVFVESYLQGLDAELFAGLTDRLGEVTHLSELVLAKKLAEEEIEFGRTKLEDEVLEYLGMTTVLIFSILATEEIPCSEESYKLYRLIYHVAFWLRKMRGDDQKLMELKEKLRKMMIFDESE